MQYMVTPTVPYAGEVNTISLQDSNILCFDDDDNDDYSHVSPTSHQASSESSDDEKPINKMTMVMAASMLLTDSPPRTLNDPMFEADPEEVQQQGAGTGEHLHATPSPSPSQVTHAKWVGARLEALKAAAKAASPNPDPAPTSPKGSVTYC